MSNKPTIQKENLPGSFWGITTFFNSAGYRNKYSNYRMFREASKKQGLKLLAVEVVFDDSDFELKKESDADILIQLRGDINNIMWQKERMLNIGLQNLPQDCDKIAWLDCDIIFENNNWVEETSGMLLDYKIVQPFGWAVRLLKGETSYNFNELPDNVKKERKMKNMTSAVYKAGVESFQKSSLDPGFYGFAWAARRSIFDKIGFFDKNIMGGGDFIMARSFWGSIDIIKKFYHHKMISCMENWMEKIYSNVQGSVYYIDGGVLHLWHGREDHKWHRLRRFILAKYDFDPNRDIKINSDALYSWVGNKKSLQRAVWAYFYARREEGGFKIFFSLLFLVVLIFEYYLKKFYKALFL